MKIILMLLLTMTFMVGEVRAENVGKTKGLIQVLVSLDIQQEKIPDYRLEEGLKSIMVYRELISFTEKVKRGEIKDKRRIKRALIWIQKTLEWLNERTLFRKRKVRKNIQSWLKGSLEAGRKVDGYGAEVVYKNYDRRLKQLLDYTENRLEYCEKILLASELGHCIKILTKGLSKESPFFFFEIHVFIDIILLCLVKKT